MAETVLGGVLEFFVTLGVYDVVLPFLLVFSIMFALLEKTKIFGTEGEVGGVPVTRKNINAMVSFVVAFFVIASARLVEAITTISSHVVLLLMLSVFFLLLISSFFSRSDLDEGKGLEGGWKTTFGVIMFVGILAIFLNAIKIDDGTSWLEIVIGVILQFTTNTAVAAIVLIIVLILFIVWLTGGFKGSGGKKEGD